MPLLRHLYRSATILWLVALPAAAYAATREHASALLHACAFTAYTVGSLICHQRPERSFHLWSAQLPVCARCTGIYVGAAAATLRTGGWLNGRALDAAFARRVMILAALPTLATLGYEWTTAVAPSNWIRFAAGLPLGGVVSWLVLRVN